jgi:rhodanese-related sulfurtransferase
VAKPEKSQGENRWTGALVRGPFNRWPAAQIKRDAAYVAGHPQGQDSTTRRSKNMPGLNLVATHSGAPEPLNAGAKSVPWKTAANDDGTFKHREELEKIYQDNLGYEPDRDTIVYCRIGERSSHTWFVLTKLLGFENVRNYDGSWTEWGNMVRVPVEKE